MPIEVAPTGNVPSSEAQGKGTGVDRETIVKSKILSHFIKGKISLSPMEIVLMIPGELEHLENLVKLARRKKDVETVNDQVSVVSPVPTIKQICVNKMNRSKTLHLPVEINRCVIKGLLDTGASIFVMAAAIVRELGMMHLIVGSETYKIASGVVTQALGQIDEVPMMVGGVQCTMTLMVVDTNSYNVLLGLDFLIKIGAIVDVDQGLIQVRKGPGADVEVSPLMMVNLLQRVNSGSQIQDTLSIRKKMHNDGDANWTSHHDHAIMTKKDGSSTLTSDEDTDDSERSDPESNQLQQIDCENEFRDVELEEFIKSEGM
jgi:predicted aspartyl protease